MHSVRIFNNISQVGLSRFPVDDFQLIRDADAVDGDKDDVDVVLCRSHSLQDFSIPARLLAVGRAGAGVNNIPVDRMTDAGVAVFNTPGANANAVRELTIGSLIIAARNIKPAFDYVDKLSVTGEALSKAVEQGKKQFVGRELSGKTLGIVGLGSIGRGVAEAALALGMRVIGYDPKITVEAAWQLSRSIDRARSVDDLVARSEFVSIHVPLTDLTADMFDEKLLSLVRPGAVLINLARDGIVDDNAVRDALNENRLFFYITDFPSTELKSRQDVISLPHLGASTLEAEENCAQMVVDQVCDYLKNGNITNSVNFPTVVMARGSEHRLFVVNRNVPNMVGQISTQLANANLNIHDMINQSRGDIACTVVDVDSPIGEDILQAIKQVDGVLAARLL